jgi:hypothetical protein
MVSNGRECVLNAQRYPLLAIAVALIPTFGTFQPMAVGSPQAQDTEGKQIEVRLIPKKKSIKVGDTAKDSFARRLVYRWTTLPTRDFYGTVVAMDPASFPQLNTPGRWRLRGTYKSIGNLSSSHCWDTAPIPDNEEQIKGLPYEAWQGEVNTNTVWIEVLRARSSATVKKSP